MTGEPDQSVELACAERLIQVLLPLMRQLSAETEAAGGDGLTVAQFRLLAALQRRPYTAGELACHLGVAASTVSGLIAPLVKRGLVERSQSANDRRMVELQVTAHGQSCYRRMEERVLDFLTRVFTGLPTQTKLALLAGLNGLDAAMGYQRGSHADITSYNGFHHAP